MIFVYFQELLELNTSSASILQNFITWPQTTYPSANCDLWIAIKDQIDWFGEHGYIKK